MISLEHDNDQPYEPINRISDIFYDDDDEVPVPRLPEEKHVFVVDYHRNGVYSVHKQDENNHSKWDPVYAGQLGDAIRYTETAENDFRKRHKEYEDLDITFISEGVEAILPDREYGLDNDLDMGEIYWWGELNQYGPYPGDDWYEEQSELDDDEWLDHLNR